MKTMGATPSESWKVGAAEVDMTRPASLPRPLRIEAEPQTIVIDAAKSALVIVGMQNDSDQCVMITLEDSSFIGYDVVLARHGAATTSPAFCTEATLYNIKQLFGFVTKSETVLASFDASPVDT